MLKQLREQAISLRKQEFSYSEIKKRLNVSKSTLSYWLRDLPLSKEKILELRRSGWSKGEASREKYRATMRERKDEKARLVYEEHKKKFSNISDESIFIAGLMLYLGEGSKKKDSTLAIANTDPNTITFFIGWLEKYLDVSRSEIRIQLHLYENMDTEREQKYWQKILRLKYEQFYKISVRKLKESSFSYQDSFRHGTCSLYVFGTERVTKVMMAMKALVDTMNKNK